MSKKNSKKIDLPVPTVFLPTDFEQLLKNYNFETKGRKQSNHLFGKMSIKGYNLYSLRRNQYVNDLIIDNYFKLICKRNHGDPSTFKKSYAFGTYFFHMLNFGHDQDKLVSWIKHNLQEFDLVFLPFNKESHWLLFVADMVNKRFFVYNPKHNDECALEINQIS